MQGLTDSLINAGTQCWACPLFDTLFDIVSNTAGILYKQLTSFGIVIFGILFTAYIFISVWQNIKSGMSDSFFMKSLKPVLINSLLVISILGLGLTAPRLISRITFEPVAYITLEYSKAMLESVPDDIKSSDDYKPKELNSNGFFNTELRNTVLQIMQTSVTGFQSFIKIGFAVLESAFSIPKDFDLSLLLKRILVFFIGLSLTYSFMKYFIQYSFCFIDIIVAMAIFAFFFPLSLVFFVFHNAKDAPSWMKGLGDGFSKNIKSVINAIVSVAATILTYTIIILIIRGYLVGNDISVDMIQNGAQDIFNFDIDNPSAVQVTFFGIIVLVFVIDYLKKKIPDVTKEILGAFNVSTNDSMSEAMGQNVLQLTNLVADQTKQAVKNYVNPETKSKENTATKETKK